MIPPSIFLHLSGKNSDSSTGDDCGSVCNIYNRIKLSNVSDFPLCISPIITKSGSKEWELGDWEEAYFRKNTDKIVLFHFSKKFKKILDILIQNSYSLLSY